MPIGTDGRKERGTRARVAENDVPFHRSARHWRKGALQMNPWLYGINSKIGCRKWLSNPVRKRSQGRMDRTPDKPSTGETPNSGRGERKTSGGAKITSIKVSCFTAARYRPPRSCFVVSCFREAALADVYFYSYNYFDFWNTTICRCLFDNGLFVQACMFRIHWKLVDFLRSWTL